MIAQFMRLRHEGSHGEPRSGCPHRVRAVEHAACCRGTGATLGNNERDQGKAGNLR